MAGEWPGQLPHELAKLRTVLVRSDDFLDAVQQLVRFLKGYVLLAIAEPDRGLKVPPGPVSAARSHRGAGGAGRAAAAAPATARHAPRVERTALPLPASPSPGIGSPGCELITPANPGSVKRR